MTDDQIEKLFAPEARPRPRAAAPASAPQLLCTGCVLDAKHAVLAGKPPAEIPEPLPGVVMIQGMLLCEVRHTVNVGAPQLLVAQPGQMPGGLS